MSNESLNNPEDKDDLLKRYENWLKADENLDPNSQDPKIARKLAEIAAGNFPQDVILNSIERERLAKDAKKAEEDYNKLLKLHVDIESLSGNMGPEESPQFVDNYMKKLDSAEKEFLESRKRLQDHDNK